MASSMRPRGAFGGKPSRLGRVTAAIRAVCSLACGEAKGESLFAATKARQETR